MEKQLQYLLDRLALEDQIKLYAHLLDTKQFDRMFEVFMPGAQVDYSVTGGAKGQIEEIKEYLKEGLGPFRSQHLATNIMADIASDRKSAKTTHILFNPMTMDLKGKDYTFFCGLFYDCDWVITEEGTWKITKMMERDCYFYRPQPPKG